MSLVIENYQHLSTLTDLMREAAASGEWDSLVALEKRCAKEIAAFKPRDVAPVNEDERKQKAALIKKILADDKAIRERTEQWMHQLQQIMQNTRTEQRLQQTYLSQG